MERVQPSAKAERITMSHPLFGPSIPFRVTGPSLVQVEKTPITAAAIAIQATSRIAEASAARRVASSGNEPRR